MKSTPAAPSPVVSKLYTRGEEGDIAPLVLTFRPEDPLSISADALVRVGQSGLGPQQKSAGQRLVSAELGRDAFAAALRATEENPVVLNPEGASGSQVTLYARGQRERSVFITFEEPALPPTRLEVRADDVNDFLMDVALALPAAALEEHIAQAAQRLGDPSAVAAAATPLRLEMVGRSGQPAREINVAFNVDPSAPNRLEIAVEGRTEPYFLPRDMVAGIAAGGRSQLSSWALSVDAQAKRATFSTGVPLGLPGERRTQQVDIDLPFDQVTRFIESSTAAIEPKSRRIELGSFDF